MRGIRLLCRLDTCLFENLTAAVWTLRRDFENVIRHAWIRPGNAIQDGIEGNLSAQRIAVLAGFDELLGLAQDCNFDEFFSAHLLKLSRLSKTTNVNAPSDLMIWM